MRTRTRHRRLALASLGTAFALVGAACTDGNDSPGAGGPDTTDGGVVDISGATRIVALQPFDDCEAELAYLKEQALAVVGPYGVSGVGPIGIATGAAEDTAGGGAAGGPAPPAGPATTVAASADGATASSGEKDFSGTNVQEVGIDEPDVVKTDGRRIVAVAGNTLYVVDASGDAPVLVGSLTLGDDSYGGRLLLAGDHALLITQSYGDVIPVEGDVAESESEIAPYSTRSKVVDVDLTDPANPVIAGTLSVDGYIIDARQVGEVARVVVSAAPEKLPFLYPSSDTPAAIEAATEYNKTVIENSTIDDWLPHYTLENGGEVTEGRAVECAAMSHPGTFSGFSTLAVLTLDMAAPLSAGNGVGVLSDGQMVYASASNLYVTTTQWVDPAAADPGAEIDQYTTAVHQFDITGTDAAAYVASGAVEGYLLNSYSMSERDGYLRVAATRGSPWEGSSESGITVLHPEGAELVTVASVDGLGVTEQIYAVRYVGPLAFVVTFRQTDPLYVIDLNDPLNPTVSGELKINGYSSYLHPVGENLLLGIGQDATDEGRVLGIQVSLFDVSDPANPVRLQQLTLGSGSAGAEYDPHAFLWWEATGTAVLPIQTYGVVEGGEVDGDVGVGVPDTTVPPDSPDTTIVEPTPVPVEPVPVPPIDENIFTGAVGVHVDPSSVAEVGRVSHAAHAPAEWGPYGAPIERSLVIGDTLYTFSQIGIAAADLATFTETGFVPFPVG